MASKKLKSKPPTSFNFIDGASMWQFCTKLNDFNNRKLINKGKIAINFDELTSVLNNIRVEAGWTNTNQINSLLFAAIDPENKSQLAFVKTIEKIGISVDVTDYKKIYGSLTARISYAMGLQARHDVIELIVLTHDYGIGSALLDLSSRSIHFKVGLAYFGCLLEDQRWHSSPVLEANSPVKLFNLDEYASKILGGDWQPKRGSAFTQSLCP